MGAQGLKPKRFFGKKAVVTGASSGIGEAIARRLSEEGCEVFLVARTQAKLKAVCEDIGAKGGKAQYFQGDLSSGQEREDLCQKLTMSISDQVHILVNAAGVQKILPLVKSSPEIWRELMEVNVIAAADLLNKLAAKLKQGSSVVNVASVAGEMASPGMGVYAATKAALLSWTKTAAAELAGRGIRVNAVVPGMIQTPMLEEMLRFYSKEHRLQLEKRHPMGFGKPDDVAHAVCFLASEDARWMTGVALHVDGGFSLTY